MQLAAGRRLRSTADDTQVIVVKAPAGEIDLTCGGQPLVPIDAEVDGGASVAAGHEGPTLIGKRYADDGIGIELLCTKGGDGALFVNGAALPLKEAKPLPSSD
jgi:hypothetical protein